jgi:hypothetical protein
MQHSGHDWVFIGLIVYSVAITVLLLAVWSGGRWFKERYTKLSDNQNASFQKAIESQFGGETDWKKRSQVMSRPKTRDWIGKLRRTENRVVIDVDFRKKTKKMPEDPGPKGAA